MGPGGIASTAGRASGQAAGSAAHVAQLRSILRSGDEAVHSLLPTTGNRLELLDGTEAFVERLVADVAAARHQVNFTSFALQPGTEGSLVRRVTDALVTRARDGVAVTGIVDQLGSGLLIPGAKRRASRQLIAELRNAGVEVIVKPTTLRRGPLDDARLAVDHRKLYEVDGRVSYVGGVNLVDGWSSWHDTMVRGEGPVAAQVGAALAGRWRSLGGTVAEQRAAVLEAGLRAPVADSVHATRLLLNGNRHQRELTNDFIARVRASQDRVWLTNPYLGDPDVMAPVVDAARAGRDVRLLLTPKADHSQRQDLITDPFRRAWAWEVANAGGDVIVVPSFSHAKVWLIDDVADIGSFNLDRAATRRNYESALSTAEPAAVRSVARMFEGQARQGSLVGRSELEDWRSLARLRERLGLSY